MELKNDREIEGVSREPQCEVVIGSIKQTYSSTLKITNTPAFPEVSI